jgi:hypothetical protein
MAFKRLPLHLASTKQLAQYHKEFWEVILLILSAAYPTGLLPNTGPENDTKKPTVLGRYELVKKTCGYLANYV